MKNRHGGRGILEDVVAVITIGGSLICMNCADNADLAAVISEEDLITRQSIRDDDEIICDRCGTKITG